MSKTISSLSPSKNLRRRPAARLLVIDPRERVLLFRFSHKRGVLAGQTYWATPGGGVEEGETPEQAAIRELHEETGFVVDNVGLIVGERSFKVQLPNGEYVIAQETYFVIRSPAIELSREGWTALENEIMAEHRWWSFDELLLTDEKVFPVTLLLMLAKAGLVARKEQY